MRNKWIKDRLWAMSVIKEILEGKDVKIISPTNKSAKYYFDLIYKTAKSIGLHKYLPDKFHDKKE